MRDARSSSPHVEGAAKRGELHHERRDTPATRRGKASNGAKPPSSPGRGGVAGANSVPESPASLPISPITPVPAIFRRGGLHCGRHTHAKARHTHAARRTACAGHYTPRICRGGPPNPRRGPLSRENPSLGAPRGGNCTMRATTRRRHADRMLLMVQNPHSPAGIPPPRAADSPTRRGGRNRIGGMNRIGRRTGIVGVSIGFRTPNHPGRSAPGRCSTPDRRPLARRAAHKPPRITPTRMPPRRFARQ